MVPVAGEEAGYCHLTRKESNMSCYLRAKSRIVEHIQHPRFGNYVCRIYHADRSLLPTTFNMFVLQNEENVPFEELSFTQLVEITVVNEFS